MLVLEARTPTAGSPHAWTASQLCAPSPTIFALSLPVAEKTSFRCIVADTLSVTGSVASSREQGFAQARYHCQAASAIAGLDDVLSGGGCPVPRRRQSRHRQDHHCVAFPDRRRAARRAHALRYPGRD